MELARIRGIINAIPESPIPNAGWFRIPNGFISDAARLGPHTFAVFGVLSYHANRTGKAWPSVARIASLSGVSPRMTQYALRKLEKAGWITPVRKTGRTTEYQMRAAYYAPP